MVSITKSRSELPSTVLISNPYLSANEAESDHRGMVARHLARIAWTANKEYKLVIILRVIDTEIIHLEAGALWMIGFYIYLYKYSYLYTAMFYSHVSPEMCLPALAPQPGFYVHNSWFIIYRKRNHRQSRGSETSLFFDSTLSMLSLTERSILTCYKRRFSSLHPCVTFTENCRKSRRIQISAMIDYLICVLYVSRSQTMSHIRELLNIRAA